MKESLGIENNPETEKIIVHSVFTRHGKKFHDINNPETALSSEGEEKSREFGRSRPKTDVAKSYSSDTDRTKDTGNFAVEEAPSDKKLQQRIREDLSFHYDKEGFFMKEATQIKKKILEYDYDDLGEEEKGKRMDKYSDYITDYYLNYGDQRPDSGTYSPVETAATMARVADIQIRMADKLKAGSKVDLINASHDFNLAAFLKEVLVREVDGEKVRGFKSIKEIGGHIDYNDNFEILITKDNSGHKELKILFRDKEYGIDEERLKELVDIANNIKEESK